MSTDTLALWGFIMGAVGTVTGIAALGLEFYRERQSRKERAAEEERRRPRVVIQQGLTRHRNEEIFLQVTVRNDGHVVLHNVTAVIEVSISRKDLQTLQASEVSTTPIGDLLHLESGQPRPVALEVRQEHEFYLDGLYLRAFTAQLDAGWLPRITVKDGGVAIGTLDGPDLAKSIRSAAAPYITKPGSSPDHPR